MKKEQIAFVKQLLFSEEYQKTDLKTYAIVDSVREENATQQVIFSALNSLNLWSEEIESETQTVQLHLVELKKESELVTYLLEHHEKSVATYFLSSHNLEELGAYYSSFTLADIEDEKEQFKKGIFGFYDPNILPNYIKTLYSHEKIAEFFAGITICFSPNPKKEDELTLMYPTGGTEVTVETVTLKEPIETTFLNSTTFTKETLEPYEGRRVIDHVQVGLFKRFAKEEFLERLFIEYEKNETWFKEFEEASLQRASTLYDEAKELYDIESGAGLYRYILLGMKLLEPVKSYDLHDNLLNASVEWERLEQLDKIIDYIKKENVDV